MKKFLSGLILGVIISISLVGIASELNIVPNPFPVLINGKETPVDGWNIEGSTFLKLRDFEKVGLVVQFNEKERQIEIVKGGNGMAKEVYKIGDLEITKIDGIEYVTLIAIKDQFRFQNGPNVYSPKIAFDFSYINKVASMFKEENGVRTTLIEEIPHIVVDARVFIKYSYYISTIEPLIK